MSPPSAPDARPSPAKFILVFVAICAIEKAIAMLVTGFGDDEAYTLVISRTLALSYFDHPPLHQWLLHGFVALFGSTADRPNGLIYPNWPAVMNTAKNELATAADLFPVFGMPSL